MNKHFSFIGILIAIACCWTACKDDIASAGQSVLDENDAVVVLADTFPILSVIDSCDAIISQADSFLLGELETDYGLLRASILTQLACPEGYSYPENAEVDDIYLFLYYASWVGDGSSPLAINAYMMDRKTFNYSSTYPTDLNIADYCTRDNTILTNHRIVAASEKMDSVSDSNGNYLPMLRIRVNDEFKNHFWAMQSFGTQDDFNQIFKGLLLESSFGSSTVLNISDIALGVYYHFSYDKGGHDTTVYDMKAFYANSEVRTVNHLYYQDKKEWIENMQQQSDTYNYIIAPAGVYTRVIVPMARIEDTIKSHMQVTTDGVVTKKRPYVNKAQVRIDVTNKYTGTDSQKQRNDWLQPANYMLLIKEESMSRFFKNRELPSDTCALLSALIQSVDSLGDAVYYYNYDLSEFLTNQLRTENNEEELRMMLVPVTVNISTTSNISQYSSVRQEQTISATQIRSAQNGTELEIVYCGMPTYDIE